jgi:hypothetical protein
MIYDDDRIAAFDEDEEREIYWDLFCGGKRPRVLNIDEWNLMNEQKPDEDKDKIDYER